MPLVCSRCGVGNPDIARFCLSCGNALVAVAERPRERKYVACLFADLVGSTTLGEHEDPEVVQDVVSRTFARLGEEVHRYGGTIDKVMGDAILALFGVPAAHEDDPERAVRAGLDMQSVLAALNREAAAAGRPELAMRVGIEAGEVMVLTTPAADLPDRMVTGDAANTASRLQTAADPGAVVVGPAVHTATRDVFSYRELAPLTLKGKAEPVPAWVALEPLARPGERPDAGGAVPLVGRSEELDLLLRSLRRAVAQERPALVSIIGAAGVGKSRLAAEFASALAGLAAPPGWLHGRCLPYGDAPYSALREAVAGRCGVSPEAGSDEVAARVEEACRAVGLPAAAMSVAALLGVTPGGPMAREVLFEGWRGFLEALAGDAGVVVALEDIHWADDGLLDFVDHVADWGRGRMMVLTLSRPDLLDLRPGWGGGKRSYSSIMLEPLSTSENEILLEALLGGPAPPALVSFVRDRSEGNPLFTEELVRALVDRGALVRADGPWRVVGDLEDVRLPRSVQGVIASRIDGLPSAEKAVLADAGAIGRTFWLGALADLSGADTAGLRPTVDRLRLRELIVRNPSSAFPGDEEYSFRHALIRDVAYEGLPKSVRAARHAATARWIERTADHADDNAEVIGAHYAEALRYLREVGRDGEERSVVADALLAWAMKAGERAERVKDLSEAISWFEEAAAVARERASGPDLATILERLADAYFPAGRLADAEREYRAALDLREHDGDEGGAGRVESKLTFAVWYTGQTGETWDRIQRAVARLEPLGEGRDLAYALTVYGMAQIYLRQEDGVPALRRAVEMARRADDLATLAQAATFLGSAMVHAGLADEGIGWLEEGEAVSRRLGDAESQLVAFGLLADALDTHAPTPQPARVDALAAEALEVGRKTGRDLRLERTLDTVAWMAFQRGRLEESAAALTEQLDIARKHSLPAVGPVMLLQGWIAMVRNDITEARRLLAAAQEVAAFPSIREPIVAGVVAAAAGDLDGAIEFLVAGSARDLAGSFEAGVELRYLLLETVLVARAAGRPEAGNAAAARLIDLARRQASARPFAAWVEAFDLADPADRAVSLREAVEGLHLRSEPIMEGRCLLEMAKALRDSGVDPTGTLAEARRLLEGCGATLYLAGDVGRA